MNAYLLADEQSATLVDCGLHSPAEAADHGWDELVGALRACGAEPSDIMRLVLTHPHIDHYGMAGRVVDETGCELWMHEDSRDELEFYAHPAEAAGRMRAMLADHGVSEDELGDLTAFEDWRPFVSRLVEPAVSLAGGETLAAGGRMWTVIHTPGHSPSHVCLWSETDGILISGDHLLGAITPHIDFRRGEDDDPLGEFLESLRKIEELEPALVLPGHGRPFEDGATRARVIARHHDRRLGSILQVIRNEPHSASEITDEIFGNTLLHFQRRLALGEALSHLAYLRARGEVERIQRDDGRFVYRKTGRPRFEEGDE